jgi:excisionase family DNA binding protein
MGGKIEGYLTLQEAASRLGITYWGVWRHVKKRHLHVIRVRPNFFLISEKEFERFAKWREKRLRELNRLKD